MKKCEKKSKIKVGLKDIVEYYLNLNRKYFILSEEQNHDPFEKYSFKIHIFKVGENKELFYKFLYLPYNTKFDVIEIVKNIEEGKVINKEDYTQLFDCQSISKLLVNIVNILKEKHSDHYLYNRQINFTSYDKSVIYHMYPIKLLIKYC